jgi:anti-sigma factor RsiW
MNRIAQEQLMRYFDGDLDAEETARVERWISESEEARALARDLKSLGDAVRSISEDRAASSDSIADAVMARLQEGPVSRTRIRAPSARGMRKTRRIQAAIPAIGLALAAAAAVAVYFRPHVRPQSAAERPAATLLPESFSAIASVAGDTAGPEPETGASIESVDFGAQNGTIFIVANGLQVTPVVWLMDDDDPSSG